MKQLFPVLGGLLMLSACNNSRPAQNSVDNSNLVTFFGLVPGAVPMDTSMRRIGIYSSAINTDIGEGWRLLGSMIMGEGLAIDEGGCLKLINELQYQLANTNRYYSVEILNERLKTSGSHEPTAQEVRSFAQKHNIDLVIELAHFDSDHTKIKTLVETGEIDQVGDPIVEYNVEMSSYLKAMIKTYHGTTGQLLNESMYKDHISWEENVSSKFATIFPVGDKASWVENKGAEFGELHAWKYIPKKDLIRRYYKHKGCDSLILASQFIQDDDWASAGEIWIQLRKNSNDTIAAYAMCNMAIYNEKIGDLSKAVFWMSQACEKLPSRAFIKYLGTLKQREQTILFEHHALALSDQNLE